MSRINLIKQIIGAIIILVLCNPFLYAADSRSYPVTAAYCDVSTLDIYPYSFVTRTDGSTFNCYEVLASPIPDGYRYGFEDKDDADYNDIIIECWVTGSNTSSPVAHVKYVSKEASYKHWVYIVHNGMEQLVFRAEESSPGAVYDIPLPVKECGDFEIKAEPPQRAIDQGDSTHYTVTIKALSGFSKDVNLSAAGLPAGASGVFQPNPLPITGEAKLDITTTPDVPVGIYTLTITGTAGELTRSTEVILEIKEKPPEPDFSIGADPTAQTLYPGESADFKIKLTSINGFSNPVKLYVEGLPTGAAGNILPDIVKPTAESSLTITTADTTPVGTYTLTLAGRGGGIKHKIEITLTVKKRPPEPDFDIKAEPGLQTLYRGETTGFTVTLTALNEFAEEVELNVTGIPAGTAASFTEAAVTPTGTSRLQVTTSGDTPVGTHTLTITAKGGGKEHTAAVRLEVICRDFSLQIKASTDAGPAPLTVRFEAAVIGGDRLSGPGFGFSWDFGDGSTSDQQNPEHTFQAPGNYQVTVSAVDACGQGKTAAAMIAVEGFEGAISKSFSVSEALPGDEVFISIDVKNGTHLDFTNITVQDDLAPVLEYLEDSAGVAPTRRAGQELEWQFPLLKKGETLSFKIKVKVSENAPPGAINNTAFLYHDSLGPGGRITSNTASLTVNQIEVSLHKQVEQSAAQPGDTIKYQLTIKNNSNVPLTGVNLTDELSDYLEFVSAAGSVSLNLNRQGRRLQWEGTLEAQQQEVIVLKARIVSDGFAGTRIENTAKLEAAELKEPIMSETAVTTVTAEPAAGKVRFTKRSEVPQTEIGRIIRFSLTAVNMSDSTLISPVIEDHLPQGFSYVGQTTLLNNVQFSEPQGSRRLLWQLPLIKPNETVVLRYQVVIGADVKRGKNVNRAVFRAVDNSGQQVFLEASAFVNVSAAGIIFYSGVEGTVYLDRDGDDFYSMMDKPLDGIEVRMSTGEKAITDTLGQYRFENLFPGEYAVGINSATLPEKYKVFSQSPQVVVLMDGLTDTVDFAVKYDDNEDPSDAWLEGRVFFDKNQNRRYDEGDALVNSFQANIDNKLQTAGQNGKFLLYKLKTGTHTLVIKLNNRSSPKIVELKQGKNVMDFPLKYSLINIVIKGEDK